MSITLAIILITAIVSFPAFNNEKLRNDLLFWPYMVARYQQHYRFISGGVVHADLFHLAFNMISLYSFGMALEAGKKRVPRPATGMTALRGFEYIRTPLF